MKQNTRTYSQNTYENINKK